MGWGFSMPIAAAAISESLERCPPLAWSWQNWVNPNTWLTEARALVPTSLPHLNVLIESHT